MKVNEKIRTLREINNLTQEEMAEKLQMSKNGYANIERGDSKIHIEKLEQIASVLGIDVLELMSFGEKNTVYCMGGKNNVNSGLNLIGRVDDYELLHSVEKLKLTITHQKEVIDFQKQEIQSLKEFIALLKDSK